jgi:hypothetical protein
MMDSMYLMDSMYKALRKTLFKPDAEIAQGVGRLSKEDRSRFSSVSKKAVLDRLSEYTQDISCSGCVRTVRDALSATGFWRSGIAHALFSENAECGAIGAISMRPFLADSDGDIMGRVFAIYNSPDFFSRRGQGKRQRCSLHTAHPRVEEDWLQVWSELGPESTGKIAQLGVDELSDSLSAHLKQLYFCLDCRGNVLRALDILVGCVDPEELESDEEYSPEIFEPFSRIYDDDEEEVYASGEEYGDGVEDEEEEQIPTTSTSDRRLGVAHTMRRRATSKGRDKDGSKADLLQDVSSEGGKSTDTLERADFAHPAPSPSLYNVAAHSGGSGSAPALRLSDGKSHEAVVHARGRGAQARAHDARVGEEYGGKGGHDEGEAEDSEDEDETDSNYSYSVGAVAVVCDHAHVPKLLRDALEADARDEAQRLAGVNNDRHAPTLRDGQIELMLCIGKLLLARIKEHRLLKLARMQTDELLVWLILSCMRTSMQDLLGHRGNDALIALLEEEDREKEQAEAKRNKKKAKKQKKKENKKSRGLANDDDESSDEEDTGKLKDKNKSKGVTAAVAVATTKPPAKAPVKTTSKAVPVTPPVPVTAVPAPSPPAPSVATGTAAPKSAVSSSETPSLNGRVWSADSEARLMAQFRVQLSESNVGEKGTEVADEEELVEVGEEEQEDDDIVAAGRALAQSIFNVGLLGGGPAREAQAQPPPPAPTGPPSSRASGLAAVDDVSALTEEELREASAKLHAAMRNSSREQLRERLRAQFDSLVQARPSS